MRSASEVRVRRPLLWRLLVLFLALLPIDGAAATIAVAVAAPQHRQCTDHVCSCARKCPPKQAAARRSCHGAESEAPVGPLFQSAGCHHGDDSIGPVATTPHLIPAPVEIDPGFPMALLVSRASARPLAGFPTLDLQPPKTRT